MEKSDAIALIEQCLQTGGDVLVDYNNEPRKPHINVCNDFNTKTVEEYALNMDSIEILYVYDRKDAGDQWDGDHETAVVFKYDIGYVLAVNTGWRGPTFSEEQWDLYVHESHSWRAFDKACLTDEMREKLVDIIVEKELLGKEF
jgi:hypothetical protein